jgi:hypothetical protein
MLSGSLFEISSEILLEGFHNSLMHPSGRMDFIPLQRTMVRVYSSELYILAEIVSSISAKKALSTGYTRLHGNTITSL